MKFNLSSSSQVITGFLCLFSLNLSASEGHVGVDVSLSNDSGNFAVYSLREKSKETTNLGVAYFFNEDQDRLISAFVSTSRKGMGSKNLEMGIKAKVYVIDQNANKQFGSGLMLGLTSRYWFPTSIPVSFALEGLYNPPIVASGDIKKAYSVESKLELRMLPSAIVYIGFRALTVDFKVHKDYRVDRTMHVGINVAIQ